MKKLGLLALSLIMLLALNLSALAQDEEEGSRDLLEVALFAGGAFPLGGISDWVSVDRFTDTGNVAIGAKTGLGTGVEIGVFLSPNLVLGLSFNYSQHELDTQAATGDLKHRFYNPAVYLKHYWFAESNFVPYVRIQAGIDNAKFTTRVFDPDLSTYRLRELSYNPAFAFGGGAGLFYYTSDYSGLYAEANIHYATSKNVTGTFKDIKYDFGESATMLNLQAGIRVFFGGDE